MSATFQNIKTWGSLVKFSHTIFALPFALSMAIVVSRTHPISTPQIIFILICLVSARTAAMGFNRLMDADIDAKNPRTQSREIPAGKLSKLNVKILVFISSLIFLAGSYGLGLHCLILAPLVLGVLLFYSWTKRFTSVSHLVLGLCLALAPGGVWYALTAEFRWLPVIMMAGVLFWVAGFDIIYSCQDEEFDRKEKLFSLPAKIGIGNSLLVARVLHCIATVFLVAFGYCAELGTAYYIGVTIFSLFLLSQHRLVSAEDLSRVDAAFFTRNGLASVVYLLSAAADRWIS